VLVDAEDIGGSDSYSGTVDWKSGHVVGLELLRTPPFTGSRRPVPSPDGKMVAFVRKGRGYGVRPGWQIPVVHSFDTGQDRVYPTALTIRDAPVWYPDQRALLFAMLPEGGVGDSIARVWRFLRLDLGRGAYTEVGKTGGSGLVRMAGMTARSLYYLLGGKQVMALDWQTGASRKIFQWAEEGQLTDAAVLGEGERIAFVIYGRPATVFVVKPGEKPVRIAQLQANNRPQLIWGSDGKSILASGALAGKQGIWRIPVDGGDPQRVNLDEPGITEVRLSENGQRIAYTQRIDRPREVWAYDLPAAK
jgi:Tol biopolymer transport system component